MLVLSRRPGEVVRIGDDIVVRVLSVGRYQVRIGIEAPHEIRVFREELYKALAEANVVAAQVDYGDEEVAAMLLTARKETVA